VSNIMLITVKERTHEFGIRKALGARPWSILRSVMAESILITAFFGYVGMVAGIAATEWLNVVAGTKAMEVADMKMEVFLNPTVDLGIAVQALLVLVVAGLVAGFVPARKAVRVKPVEALNAR
ncbi:MAG: FtsX-like permease family protein, partial [Bacteroidaceae bacterium]|nr:FtsX-like permease family protein [Bacteroidaceae bacterium]